MIEFKFIWQPRLIFFLSEYNTGDFRVFHWTVADSRVSLLGLQCQLGLVMRIGKISNTSDI